MFKNISMEGLSMETIVRDGNCEMFPLNIQRVIRYVEIKRMSQDCQ
jgi:hypothetical protein